MSDEEKKLTRVEPEIGMVPCARITCPDCGLAVYAYEPAVVQKLAQGHGIAVKCHECAKPLEVKVNPFRVKPATLKRVNGSPS